MDRPERLDRSGTTAAQAPGRGLPENPAQGRRVPLGPMVPLPPIPHTTPNQRSGSSGPMSSAPITASQVITLAREAMKDALQHSDLQAGEEGNVNNELTPGLTIDLSRKNIQKLPDDVVDIIMNKLERLALSHNKLTAFPTRFSECSSLRYLNVRENDIREFPLPLCNLKSLEILDLGRNKLRFLPPDIAKLSSLKVFALQKNRIEELPLCLADMSSLQMIKLTGNPIRFPPPEVFQVQTSNPPNEGHLKDNEVTEVTVTSHIRKFLKQRAVKSRALENDTITNGGHTSGSNITVVPAISVLGLNGGVGGSNSAGNNLGLNGTANAKTIDSPEEDSSDVSDLQRPLLLAKRVTSGRFPIKVNWTEVGDLRSPPQPRPPPIPTRSHYRGLSQQNTIVRRPGVMPLTIGNVNERLRSSSEVDSAGGGHRSGGHSGRIDQELRREGGLPARRSQGLIPLGEVDGGGNNRFSHCRGLSHGSAMQGKTGDVTSRDTKSPRSPLSEDASIIRPVYVRRLSILPERRRDSQIHDLVVEAAKGILYSVFQIHPLIQMLLGLANDGTARNSSLGIVFYNTNSHVEQLEREIQRHDIAEDCQYDLGLSENETVHRACVTLLHAYDHICSLLRSNADLFLDNGDPRYMRTLLLQIYHSIMELRVAVNGNSGGTNGCMTNGKTSETDISVDGVGVNNRRPVSGDISPRSEGNTVKPFPLLQESTPKSDWSLGGKGNSLGQNVFNGLSNRRNIGNPSPSNIPVTTGKTVQRSLLRSYANGNSTVTLMMSTPGSGESFRSARSGSTGQRPIGSGFVEEDQLFEGIFLSLQKSSDLALQVLPSLKNQCVAALRSAMTERAPEIVTQCWRGLMMRCAAAIQHTEMLKKRLSSVVLKEPGLRSQQTYWALCRGFLEAWLDFAGAMRKSHECVQLPADMRPRMRPLFQCVKDTISLISRSPWAYTVGRQGGLLGANIGGAAGFIIMSPLSTSSGDSGDGGNGVQYGTVKAAQLPVTPQSAALGPAVQATVPSTPQSATFANTFTGNVFERADALISAGGLSMSRGGSSSNGGSGYVSTTGSIYSLNGGVNGLNGLNGPMTLMYGSMNTP